MNQYMLKRVHVYIDIYFMCIVYMIGGDTPHS